MANYGGFQAAGYGGADPYSQFGLNPFQLPGMGGQGGFGGLGIGNPSSYTAGPLSFMDNFMSGFEPFGMAEGMGGIGQVMGASGLANDMFTMRDPNQGWLGAGLQGAIQGAGAGSMFGPMGAAVGAPIGYVSGKK